MKNYLKEKIFKNFLFIFEKEIPGLTESNKRKLCEALVESSYQVFLINSQELIKQSSISVKEFEYNRKQFKDLIDEIQKSTDKLLTVYKSNSFVSKEFDEITRTFILKPRTTMVNEMVEYLNMLNKLVINFYKEVYKIEQTSIDYPKISLF
jgi:histidinol phosphatase-like enzyme